MDGKITAQAGVALSADERNAPHDEIIGEYLTAIQMISLEAMKDNSPGSLVKLASLGANCYKRVAALAREMTEFNSEAVLSPPRPAATPLASSTPSTPTTLAHHSSLTRSEQLAVADYEKHIAFYAAAIKRVQGPAGSVMDAMALGQYRELSDRLEVARMHLNRLERLVSDRGEATGRQNKLRQQGLSTVERGLALFKTGSHAPTPATVIDRTVSAVLKQLAQLGGREDAVILVRLLRESTQLAVDALQEVQPADKTEEMVFRGMMPVLRERYANWFKKEQAEYATKLGGVAAPNTPCPKAARAIAAIAQAGSPTEMMQAMQAATVAVGQPGDAAEDLVVRMVAVLATVPDARPVADCALVEDLADDDVWLDGTVSGGVATMQEAASRVRRR